MRVALGVLNKEIERLQVEIDSMSNIQSNPAKYERLTSEIEDLIEAWQVLKEWKRPKEMDFSKFFERSYKGDWNEGDRFDQNQKPLHDPTTYTQK